MSNAIYKKDLHDVALAVAQGSKDYTDKVRDNLRWEFGTYDLSVETINGTTMLLPTPANTIQAHMVRIDGASKVSENLEVLDDVAVIDTGNGITYKIENGGITLNGTATANTTIDLTGRTTWLQDLNGNYSYGLFNASADFGATIQYFIEYQSSSNRAYFINGSSATANKSGTFNVAWTKPTAHIIYIVSGATFTNFQLKPMLVSGSTAPSEFSEGFEGIHNLELSGLKVEGANLCQTPTYSGIMNNTIARSIDLGNLPNGTYTISFNVLANADNRTFILYYYNNRESANNINMSLSGTGQKSYTFTLDGTIPYDDIRLGINTGSLSYSVSIENIMLVRGSTPPTSFVPYIAPTTLPIDLSTILYNGSPLFTNGLLGYDGVADSITPYKATSEFKYLVLNGSEDWQDRPNFNDCDRFVLNTDNAYKSFGKGVCDKFTFSNNLDSTIGNIINNQGQQIIVNFSTKGTTTLTQFKTWLSNNNVILVIQRATPIEADIDFSQLVKFEAYSNGSTTLVNTNNQDATSTFKYLKEVAK